MMVAAARAAARTVARTADARARGARQVCNAEKKGSLSAPWVLKWLVLVVCGVVVDRGVAGQVAGDEVSVTCGGHP